MKKTILAGLMIVMVFSPCLAQRVETEEMFSIEGTVWLSTIIDSFCPELIGESHYHTFHKGTVYISGELYILKHSVYVHLPQGSLFLIIRQPKSLNLNESVIGFVYHFGIGIASDGDNIFLLCKINDNWIPPEVEQVPAHHPRFLIH